MRRTLRLLLLLALAGSAAPASAAAGDDLAQVREKIAAAQARIAATRGELSKGQAALRDAEKAQAKTSAALRAAKRRETALAASLARLDADRRALDRKSATQAQALARDMRDAWELGRHSPMRLWLNADDPGRAARVARYYDYLQRDRTARLAAFRETRTQLLAMQEKTTAEQQQLATARDELAAREQDARSASTQRRDAVRQLAGELQSQRSTLDRLRADEAELKRVLEQASKAFRDVPPEAVGAPLAQRKGKLRWPVTGRIVARYGSPLAEGKLTLNGIEIAAAEGSEVRAVHPGRVVYADWLRGYGLLLIIDHGGGFLTVYGHNQSLLRGVGDWVAEGEPVATVGTSGGRSDPTLYFEMRVAGEPQDPARWLRR